MNIDDLKKVVHLGASGNLQASANELNITAGALSKTLKKVEQQFHAQLFDRVGRNLQLNAQGAQFIEHATQLIHEFEQMQSAFVGDVKHQVIRLAAPAILLASHLPCLSNALLRPQQSLHLATMFETQVIKQITNGQADIGLVTRHGIKEAQSTDFAWLTLNTLHSALCVSADHVLAKTQNVSLSDVLNFDFACPLHSPFCGVKRGIGSDGWPDHQYPRNIGYRSDDFYSLLNLLKCSDAVGFLPRHIALYQGLVVLPVEQTPEVLEDVCLVYRPSHASGWLHQFVERLSQR